MADPFPEDVKYDILSRLPVKSLARFRCVSKLWLKHINDPYLDSIHHVKEEPTPILFQPFPHGDEPNKIRVSLLVHGVQKKPVLELDYSVLFFGYLLLGSCKGLSLVCYEQDPCRAGIYGFALINPLSKQRHDLPPLPINFGPYLIDLEGPCQATGIGFDDSTNTLKTVFFIVKDSDTNLVCTMVHSLGNGSWRETAQTPAYPIIGEGVFAHGRLHWLVDRWQTEPKPEEGRQIVWFDVKTEEFGLRYPPKPKEGDKHWIDYNQLVDLNGELGFMCFGPFGIKLWILRHEEWMFHCWFNLRSYLPRKGRKYGEYNVEIPGCWNKDGDILVAYNHWERLFVYTLKTGDLRRVADQVDLRQAHIRMHRSSLFFSRLH